jgi:hypothetical protein
MAGVRYLLGDSAMKIPREYFWKYQRMLIKTQVCIRAGIDRVETVAP